MFKKLLTIAFASVLTLTMSVGCTKQESKKEDSISIGMITDIGGINDGSFNESTWKGLKKAKEDLGVEVYYLESNQDADYKTNIETFIDKDVDLILGVGYNQTNAFKEAAKQYPERKFALIDGDFDTIPDNVKNIKFKEEEAGYLAGILAANTTKTGVVGFIGGMSVPAVDSYKYGFMAAVHDVNPDITIMEQYANTFTDASKGRAIAEQMMSKDADIIFHAAGPVGNGMFEALKEKGLLGIGVDTDQNSIAPDTVMTSAVKHLNIASYNLARDLALGNFQGGGVIISDLSNDGVGIAKVIKAVPAEAVKATEEYKEKIIKGDIDVPSTLEEYENYISSK